MQEYLKIHKVKIKNGEEIAYRKYGNGKKNIILIHGNMTSSKHWDSLVMLLENDFTMYAIDLRGFGASSYFKPIQELKDFADDIKHLIDEIGVKSFALIGWSTGGGVALEFASSYPDRVEKVILINSVGVKGYPIFRKNTKGEVTQELIQTKEELAEDIVQTKPILHAIATKNRAFYKMLWNMTIYTKNQPTEEKYEEYVDDMFTQRNLVDVNYALLIFNMSEEHNGVARGNGRIKNVKVPVLILQGDRDLVVPLDMAKEIEKAIQTSELKILKDCGHSPLVDCVERLANEIISYL